MVMIVRRKKSSDMKFCDKVPKVNNQVSLIDLVVIMLTIPITQII